MVIVELGPEGRPGPGFCQVAGQAHITVSWTGMVAGRAHNQSYYFGTWVQVGSWEQQKSSGRVLVMNNQHACCLPVLCLFCSLWMSPPEGSLGREMGCLPHVWACWGLAVLAKLPVGKC